MSDPALDLSAIEDAMDDVSSAWNSCEYAAGEDLLIHLRHFANEVEFLGKQVRSALGENAEALDGLFPGTREALAGLTIRKTTVADAALDPETTV